MPTRLAIVADPEDERHARTKLFYRLVASFSGAIRFATYRHNPVDIINALENSPNGAPRIEIARTRLVYISDSTSTAVRVLRVSGPALELLLGIDGSRSTLRIRQLMSHRFSGKRGTAVFRQLLTQAVSAGIIRLECPNENRLR